MTTPTAPLSRRRSWIVPSMGKGGWKQRARWLAWRCVGYYLLIAIGIAVCQRQLIYLPTRSDTIETRAAAFPAGDVHDVSYTTRDGLTLHGWHVLPTGRTCNGAGACDAELKASARVILYFPPNMGNRGERAAECRTFADLGADVLLFDYRGYGDNPGSPSEGALANDARTVWDYAIASRGLRPEQIVLFGESLGGGVATRLAAELCAANTPPAGLILSGTFSSLTETGAARFPWLPVRVLLIDRYPSIERIPAVTCPVLQLHGNQDEIVPIEFGRKLFAAAPARSSNGLPKRFVEMTGFGHNDFPEQAIRAPLREFLERIAVNRPDDARSEKRAAVE